MNRRRFVAAAFFSLVIAAVLAVIVYTEHINASQTVSVWELTHSVSAGSPYTAADVERVDARTGGATFNYEALGPGSFQARYTQNLSRGDILRQDDLMSQSAQSEIALTVQDPPPLNGGDRVDIYATFGSEQQALIGRGMLVETISGGSITILVPVQDEPSWVAVGSSSVPLHVARAAVGAAAVDSPVSPNDAIRLLCGAPCAGPAPGAAPSP